MNQKHPSELTNQELLAEAKKMKSTALLNAFLIGLVIGVVIYGVAKNNWGFFALIPLFIVFKVFNKPAKDKALKKELAERGLK